MRKNHKKRWHILCAVMALALMISNMPILDVHAELGSGNPVITDQQPDSDAETSGDKDVSNDNDNNSDTDLDGEGDKLTTDPEKESDTELDGAEKEETEKEEASEEPIVPEEEAEEKPMEVKAFLEAVDTLWNSDSVNQEELRALIQAADDAYEALTEEQQAMEEVKAAVLTEEVRAYLEAVLVLWDIEDAEEQAAALEKISELYNGLTDEQKETVLVKAVQEALGLLDEIEPLVLGKTVYVSEDGNDADGYGTEERPFASLAYAVDEIDKETEKAYTIELLSDLVATTCARINGKDITIKGNGYTITRGENFDQIQDNARSTYNPAMIEVCNSSTEQKASLYLENITLDDGGKTAGTKYSQAVTDGDKSGNGTTVQDAIIATYDGVGTITLGDNATLKGYGGMSAVRLSGGTLVMEAGSMITGGKNFTTKGGGNGPAGAVWIQGGTFTMDEGAKIDGVTGRAVYLDGEGSNATINGTISNITANSNMWQSDEKNNGATDGVAMHIRNESRAVLGETGKIMDIEGGNCAISIINSSFTAQSGSEISGLKNTRVANANGAKAEDKKPHIVLFDGSVKDCTYGDVQFWAWYARYIIGPNAVIENTTASKKTIGMFYLQNGGEMEIGGKIQNNNNTVVYMGNQGGGQTIVKVKDGAYIHNNGGYGIYANNSGHVIMEGGEISENTSYGLYIRAKYNWKDSRLDMSGGRIINNNDCGIYYAADSGKSCYMNITGGEISGNKSKQINISGAYAQNLIGRAHIDAGIVKANNEQKVVVGTSFGTLTLDNDYSELYLGNAMSAASNKIGELAKAYKTDNNDTNEYTKKGSALWFKPTTDNLHFTVPQPSKYTINYALPLYVAYIPLKADGTPADDAELTVVKVNNTATVDINLKNLMSNQSYALMWMQQTEKFGTFTIKADPSVLNEVLGQSDYEVNYLASYTLTKDIAGLVKSGDTYTAVIELDPQLSYYKEGENDSLKLEENIAFELASTTPKLTRSSDGSRWIMEVELKVKDDFVADPKVKEYPVNLIFKATTHITNADFKDDILKTNGYMKGSVVLSGGNTPTAFKVEVPVSADTELKALPTHTITYTGGSVTVKEGTVLSSDLTGGTLGTALPGTVTEDITVADPTRGGYTFAGWTVTNGITADNISSVLFTAQWTANPTTGGGGGTTTVTPPPTPDTTPVEEPAVPLAPPTAAAVTVVAPDVEEPAAEVEDEEVPLAAPEEPEEAEEEEEPPVEMEEPEVPLASGRQWALLNLLLMILTVIGGVVMAIGATRKKEEYEEGDEESRKNSRMLHLFGIVPAIVSAVVFFLTEDMRSPMVFVDKMTVTMICITVVEVAAMVLAYRARFVAKSEQK